MTLKKSSTLVHSQRTTTALKCHPPHTVTVDSFDLGNKPLEIARMLEHITSDESRYADLGYSADVWSTSPPEPCPNLTTATITPDTQLWGWNWHHPRTEIPLPNPISHSHHPLTSPTHLRIGSKGRIPKPQVLIQRLYWQVKPISLLD